MKGFTELRFVFVFGIAVSIVTFSGGAADTDFPAIYDSEGSKEPLVQPEETLKKFKLPEGFKISLFAAEPDVQQPIGFTTDSRGRLWVAENYTYAESEKNFDKELRDRIIILEDTDNDGRFDKRKVFWDKGQKLTSVAVGFGGVWALCAPHLLFIPDRNGDDIPDGEPEVVLDGWNDDFVRHNIVNGLMWGPDGWLYGRHGILATSPVGKPGTPEKERVQINCGIWRYHPTRKIFEVVAHGTTNPWGMDFDDHGQAFFINTVIGHLFHVIPGARYKRMYGEDFNAHTYQLIDQHADHYHWNTGQPWTESRGGKGANDILGGGHAHSGLMIYLGDNWPDRYRNSLFTINLHGLRVNNDTLVRSGSGYVGKHAPDFMRTDDPWFRAIDLIYGPDGAVYIADWTDVGECHESDGVHRRSGRIYKVTYGNPAKPKFSDIAKVSDAQLIELQLHKNDWFVRQARRVLQERAADGKSMEAVHPELIRIFENNPDITRKLRAMWALHVSGGAHQSWLKERLSHPNEYVRAWAVRLLSEEVVEKAIALEFFRMAKEEKSALVRLAFASALQRTPMDYRWHVANGLVAHAEDASDHNLPLMIWYGIEPAIVAEPMKAVNLTRMSGIPLVRTFIARHLTEVIEKSPGPVDALVSAAATGSVEFQSSILQGMAEAMRGWKAAPQPKSWQQLRAKVAASGNEKLQAEVRELGLIFGDPNALEELKAIAANGKADAKIRRAALAKLIEKRPADLPALLETLVTDKAVAATAIRGLSAYDNPKAPQIVIERFNEFSAYERSEVIGELASRLAYARALLQAVEAGKIPRGAISAYHARQMRALKDESLDLLLNRVWGETRATGEEKKAIIAKFKKQLTADRLKNANVSKGRELFNQACALCHKLYGEGKEIGPDLTGSGRSNLDYLLENIVDPNAMVGADFKVASIAMKDGRVLSGVIRGKTDRTITIQSFTEAVPVERSEVQEITESSSSLMPEGLLESLDETQIAELIAYLMSTKQAPLPDEQK